ncbi:MAG: SIMPL domain-containing protein [Gammaproteobacteria bacterium]|nr:SIMPL domain-containing protein [Gammaproteobacteria bacterium]
MKKVTRILPVLMMLALPAVLCADESARSVTVDGKGSVTTSPDMAYVSMAVQARDPDMTRAREQVVKTSREFLDFCRKLGIDDSRVQATGLTIQPLYRWNEERNEQELQGYHVRRELSVELVDLDQLGEVLEGAVDLGVNEVSPPRLASSREGELHREALAEAARDAAANARVLAESLGVTLGEVIEISASRMPVPGPMPVYESMAMVRAASAEESYAAGDIRFEAQVTATFRLADSE